MADFPAPLQNRFNALSVKTCFLELFHLLIMIGR